MKNSLRAIRQQKGMKQRELAEQTGYDFRTISAYEASDGPLSKPFLEKAAEVLGVSIEEIEKAPMTLYEEGVPYRVQGLAIALEVMSFETLNVLSKALANQLNEAEEPLRGRIGEAVFLISKEVSRRRTEPSTSSVNRDAEGFLREADRQVRAEKEKQSGEARGRSVPGGTRRRDGAQQSSETQRPKPPDHSKP